MRRIQVMAGVCLGLASGNLLAQSTTSTESYTYDALGRLIKVEVTDGEQDGASRDYDYDSADNRRQVVSTEGANGASGGSGGPTVLPPECTLLGNETPSLDDTTLSWPRVYVSVDCDEDLTISYTIEHQSGAGTWTDMGFGGWTGTDPVLEASLPKDENVKLIYIQPGAGSVPTGTQLVLKVNWQVENFTGSGTTAESIVRIDGTGAPPPPPPPPPDPPCVLNPTDFAVADGEIAWPRVYAPTADGCGFPVELSYTIEVIGFQSGTLAPGQSLSSVVSDGFFAGDPILGADDQVKMIFIDPDAGLSAPGNPLGLRINWAVESGNAEIAAPGYSVVTISAD